MDFIIKRYFGKLEEDMKSQKETKVLYHILEENNGVFDEKEFVSLVEDASLEDEVSQWTIKDIKCITDIKDYRIRRLFISHFRKFNDLEGWPYMLSMVSDDKHLASLFLAGKNGSGKTSLFTGLEYIFTNPYFSVVEKRNIVDKTKFFPYGNLKEEDINISVQINEETKKETGETQNGREANYKILNRPIGLGNTFRSFFCSELDLQDIQRKTLHEIFMKELELDKMKELLDGLVKAIEDYQYKSDEITIVKNETYTYDMLQNDVLKVIVLNKRALSKTLFVLERTVAEIGRLRKIDSNQTDISKLMEDVKCILEKMLTIFSVSPEIKKLEYIGHNEVLLNNYQRVVAGMDISVFDAYQLYKNITPVETFMREFTEYSAFLLSLYPRKQSIDRVTLRKKALLLIERLTKKEEEEKQYVPIQKNNAIRSVSPVHVENLKKLASKLKELYDNDWKNIIDVCEQTIVPVLNEFTKLGDIEDEDEEITVRMEDGELCAYVKNERIFGDREIPPGQFYNSFRYKLYSISIKIALAFMTMKMKSINAPLIFDDVFTASDFDNSINIDKFLSLIFIAFKKEGLGEMKDLQLILFSHDEIVLNCISGIMDELELKGFDNSNLHFISGILLPPEMLDEKGDLVTLEENKQAYNLYEQVR